jgi:signal transduction histidine kinase
LLCILVVAACSLGHPEAPLLWALTLASLSRTPQGHGSTADRIQQAREAERLQLSLHFHDETSGDFTTMRAWLWVALEAVEAGRATDAEDAIRECMTVVERTHQSCRRIVEGMRSPMVASEGLAGAVAWLGRNVEARNPGLSVELSWGLSDPPDDDLADTLFYVVQEAVTNAERYATASSLSVKSTASGGIAVVVVADDGAGMGSQDTAGVGLISMGERVRALGGLLDIVSRPGEGVRVECRVPYAPVSPVSSGGRGASSGTAGAS